MQKTITFFFTILFSFFAYLSFAQVNNDCREVFNSGRLVCGTATFSDNSNGIGRDDFDNGNYPYNEDGCLNGEHQSAWYGFKVATSGTLTFVITSTVFSNDYDFAVYGPDVTCDSLGNPVRCNYAATTGQTGLALNAPNTSQGGAGTPFVRHLDVLAGEFYYILVDNFSNSNQGFTFTWGGTAILAAGFADFNTSIKCNVANFINTSSACEGTLVYNWDFGDGSPITSENSKKNPTHNYVQTGTYQVTLTMTIDEDGSPNDGTSDIITKQVVITKVPPITNISNLNPTYCLPDAPVTLAGTPAGGTFKIKINSTGVPIDATQFNPATLGAGTHEVTYTYKDPSDNNCVGVAVQVIEVSPLPTVELMALQNTYCPETPAFNLTATPAGGIFKIDGIESTQFNPATLSAGQHTITYTYTDPNTNCTNTTTKTTNIQATPALSFGNLRDSYCVAGAAFNIQVSPSGGILTVNGTAATQFNPTALGIGLHTVKYEYTDANSCKNTLTKQVSVAEKPVLAFQNLQTSYCADVQVFNLSATPTGGTFKINGNTAAQFNPTTLGKGMHSVRYDYTDPNDASCFNTITQTVKVNALPILVLKNVADSYCVSDNFIVGPKLEATLDNGSIQTIDLIVFNPSLVNSDSYTISTSFTDVNTNCTSTISKTITIHPLPVLNFIGLENTYCQQALPTSLQANPNGGVFKINGTVANQFNPQNFEVNDKPIISYTFKDAKNCETTITQEILITPANEFEPETFDLLFCPDEFNGYDLEAITTEQESQFTQNGKQVTYSWQPTVNNTRLLNIQEKSQEGTYTVSVRDEAGCPIAFKTFIVNIDCDPEFYVPTAFSPNGDNLNDELEIFGKDFANLDFQIFNRWGELVFRGRNKNELWNGFLNGKTAPEGVYLWKATYQNILKPEETIAKSGKITLVR